jgi:hypothetical protein
MLPGIIVMTIPTIKALKPPYLSHRVEYNYFGIEPGKN